MIQRMFNRVPLEFPDVDFSAASDVEVTFDQKTSGVELTYAEEAVAVIDETHLEVYVPKEDALKLYHKPIRYQAMFIGADGFPSASKIYTMPVDELLKDDGYGD